MSASEIDPVTAAKSKLGVAMRNIASRGGTADPATIAECRRNLTAAKLERTIRQALETPPLMTTEQRRHLARLLTHGPDAV